MMFRHLAYIRHGLLMTWGLCLASAHGAEPAPTVDLRTRGKERPVLVLVHGPTDDCKATVRAMDRVAGKYDVAVECHQFPVVDPERFKYDVLVLMSVKQRIRIRQTGSKSELYPHLVLYVDGKPLTYYPQARKGEETVTIDQFLEKLATGNVVGIEKTDEVAAILKRKNPAK